jgi:hypothetical protein
MTQSNPPQYPPPPPAPQPGQAYPPYGFYPPGAAPGVAGSAYPAGAYGYAAPGAYAPVPAKHSGVGIASLLLGILSVLGLVATTVVAVIVAGNDPSVFENENAPATIGVGVCALLCLLLSLVGIGLGIGGLVQGNRKRVFPVIGLSLNAVIVILVVGLVVLGAASN